MFFYIWYHAFLLYLYANSIGKWELPMILTTRVWIEARLKIAAKPFTGSRRSDNDDGDWHGDENDRFKGISGHVFFWEKELFSDDWPLLENDESNSLLSIVVQHQHDTGWDDVQIEEGRLRCWWKRVIKKKGKLAFMKRRLTIMLLMELHQKSWAFSIGKVDRASSLKSAASSMSNIYLFLIFWSVMAWMCKQYLYSQRPFNRTHFYL